jgi:hypothetical protein
MPELRTQEGGEVVNFDQPCSACAGRACPTPQACRWPDADPIDTATTNARPFILWGFVALLCLVCVAAVVAPNF